MAGGEENPSATSSELVEMIHEAGMVAAERDTLYNVIKVF
jgi:aminodeoxyfutalosine synthase